MWKELQYGFKIYLNCLGQTSHVKLINQVFISFLFCLIWILLTSYPVFGYFQISEDKAANNYTLDHSNNPSHNLLLKERLVELYLDLGKFQQTLQIIKSIPESPFQKSYLKKMEIECLLSLGLLDQAKQQLKYLEKMLKNE